MKKIVISLSLFLFAIFSSLGQTERVSGKIIKNFGTTFNVNKPEIKTETTSNLKVIFDVSTSSENRNTINKNIVTAARFLNMHANEGMKLNQLKVAMTIHGGAWQDVLNDKDYKEKFGVPNPNSKLIKELTSAGVEIIICGQTAMFREMNRKTVLPEVKFALSAMTALLQYQNNGYRFIKF